MSPRLPAVVVMLGAAVPAAAAISGEPAACAPVGGVPLVNPLVLGNGTPGSVTTAALQAALSAGGHIAFDLGPAPATVDVTAELVVSRAAVLDGGGRVTLSGRGQNRVLRVLNAVSAAQAYTFALQNITVADGATPTGDGAGLYSGASGDWQAVDLRLVNVTFRGNVAVASSQDGGGGGLYAVGARDVVISQSAFDDNRGSNGGALYTLGTRSLTILGTRLRANAATGCCGNPGGGGNGGAIGVDGANRTVTICGSTIRENTGNAYGVGFFSVGYDAQSTTLFHEVAFEANRNPLTTGFAAGAYLQGVPFQITASTFIGNEANSFAGLFLGPGATGDVVNSTFHANVARQGLGGGVVVNTTAPVRITNSTIVGNSAPGPTAFGGGIQVGANHALTLKNVVLAFNTGGNAFNPWNISRTVLDGGGVIQYPQERVPGQLDPPATASVVWADPRAAPPAWNGGPTKTMALLAGSPARDTGTPVGAPARDQRGLLRDASPDVGAFEAGSDAIFANGFDP